MSADLLYDFALQLEGSARSRQLGMNRRHVLVNNYGHTRGAS